MFHKRPRSRFLSCYCIPAFLSALIISVSSTATDVHADGGGKYPKCFVGTYLVNEGGGTKSLWSFGDRGILLITSSAQPSLNFSNGQGAWIRSGKLEASAVLIDFSFDNEGSPIYIARVNSDIRFQDKKCDAIDGEFTVSFFDIGIDPLDPDAIPESIISDTFSGQRVRVEQ